ncbi:hypothetical protein EV182_005590, partial [Spiromyces aspiralis]
ARSKVPWKLRWVPEARFITIPAICSALSSSVLTLMGLTAKCVRVAGARARRRAWRNNLGSPWRTSIICSGLAI